MGEASRRWGGIYTFSAVGCFAKNEFVFVSQLKSAEWSACESPSDAERFIVLAMGLKPSPASETFRFTELNGDQQTTFAYQTQEGFKIERALGQQPCERMVYQGERFDVFACPLNHGTVSLGYVVREHNRQNIELESLSKLGLKPGPWLKSIKDQSLSDDEAIETDVGHSRLGDLREKMLVNLAGDSIAYLTDFLLEDQKAEDRLVEFLKDCQTIVCENNYADQDLARKNFHMASSDVSRLAARVQPKKLVLFHLSDRYNAAEWTAQLQEVREQFARAEFPDVWKLDADAAGG